MTCSCSNLSALHRGCNPTGQLSTIICTCAITTIDPSCVCSSKWLLAMFMPLIMMACFMACFICWLAAHEARRCCKPAQLPTQQQQATLTWKDDPVKVTGLNFVNGYCMFLLVSYLYECKKAMEPLDCTLTEAGWRSLDAVGSYPMHVCGVVLNLTWRCRATRSRASSATRTLCGLTGSLTPHLP